jgi:hypothetical protein
MDTDQVPFKNNDSVKDSILWLASRQFNQKFIGLFAKWNGATLIAASDVNLYAVSKDTAEVARLITLLEVEVTKEDLNKRPEVIDISRDDKDTVDGKPTQGGEYNFLSLDNDYMSHPSKVWGREWVMKASAFRRISGLANFRIFTKVRDFTSQTCNPTCTYEYVYCYR